MRRVITMLSLALFVLGCGSTSPSGEPIEVLTGVDGCYAGGEGGVPAVLLVHPVYGTSLRGRPVMWPVGFTGLRLAGGEVAVLDSAGSVRATTGRVYYISIAMVGNEEKHQLMMSTGAFPAAANCPYSHDLVDCGLPDPGWSEDAIAKSDCGPRR